MIPGAAFSPAQAVRRGWPAGDPVLALGGLVLGLATTMMVAPLWQGIMLMVLVGWLVRTGLTLGAQLKSLRPWLPVAVVILVIHTFTTTESAPLGHPSLGGVVAGLLALLRVACTLSWLALYVRLTSLDDMVGAFHWWLAPAGRLGLPIQYLGLVLAVTLGTAPVVLGDGRRIETAVRLRRSGPRAFNTKDDKGAGNPLRDWFRGQLDRARVIVPLMESLVRRAEALNLSLRTRQPSGELSPEKTPTFWGLVLLGVWAAGLIITRLEMTG